MALVQRYDVPLRVRVAWTIALSLYSALVGLALFLDRQLDAKTWKWIHSDRLLITAVSILALATFFDAARRTMYRLRASRSDRNRHEILTQLGTVIVSLAEIHGISATELGSGLWLIQPRGIRRPARLRRLARVRLPDDLPESGVEFTKGKGTIGSCWDLGVKRHRDWIGINRKFASDHELIDHRWDGFSPEVQHGFTKQDFIRLAGRYSEVLAMPIMVDGTFEGVLAIDRRWNQDAPATRCLLDNAATEKLVGSAAKTLAVLVRR